MSKVTQLVSSRASPQSLSSAFLRVTLVPPLERG